MRPRDLGILLSALVLSAAAIGTAAQDQPEAEAPKPQPLFVRLSVHPTVSLSRYDYNNDLDMTEMRVYVELRLGSQEGRSIPNAVVTALGQTLDYVTDHYEKRIPLEAGRRPSEMELEIAAGDRPVIKERFPIPDWLALTTPRPAVVDPAQDLTVGWAFGRLLSPVDVSAYDFKTGRSIFEKDNQVGKAVVIPASSLPRATILRIYVLPSWLYKRFLSGEAYARGSEVNVVPWSQVFVRTK